MVKYAGPNCEQRLTAAPKITAIPNDPSYGSPSGLAKINAPAAWDITTGNGNLVVGTLDTPTAIIRTSMSQLISGGIKSM